MSMKPKLSTDERILPFDVFLLRTGLEVEPNGDGPDDAMGLDPKGLFAAAVCGSGSSEEF